MKPMEFVVKIGPADLAPWNGAEVPVRFVWTETEISVRFPPPPHLSPEVLKRLRVDYARIASSLTKQNRIIVLFLLNTDDGRVIREDLIEHVWAPDKIPTESGFRSAIHKLRQALIRENFGYVVQGSRTGVCSLVPVH